MTHVPHVAFADNNVDSRITAMRPNLQVPLPGRWALGRVGRDRQHTPPEHTRRHRAGPHSLVCPLPALQAGTWQRLGRAGFAGKNPDLGAVLRREALTSLAFTPSGRLHVACECAAPGFARRARCGC